MTNSSRSTPSIAAPASTSDQWAAILRYDASRRDSATSSNATAMDKPKTEKNRHRHENGPESTLPKNPKRLSLGDDLPHMPEDFHPPPIILSPPPPPRSSLSSTTQVADEKAPYSDNHTINATLRPTMERLKTPPAFKGSNAILVDRELDRLRHRREKATKRHWRIITGTSMLFVLGLCAYVLAQYVLAYLSLSPSAWFLSDATDGTQKSPDPLLRTLALIGICAAGISTLGALSSGFYLRFSRRRSCGTWSVWIAAILSTTVSLLLCIINLALIAIWHKKYASSPNDSFAVTRDVARRCNGVWDLDILWSAAKSSPIAKLDDSDNSPTCTHDGTKTLEAYLIAGGVRLILFVLFCSIWLACLARYNRTLAIVGSSNDSVFESAEMHKLLMQEGEGDLPSMPTIKDASPIPGSYSYEDEEMEQRDLNHDGYSNSTLVAPPPRLDRFRWQRTEPSFYEDEQHGTRVYGNLPHHHEKEGSAGAWSMGVVGQVWNALWGSEEPRQDVAVSSHHPNRSPSDFENGKEVHERQASKLGVRGWFQRDASGLMSGDYGRDVEDIEESRHFLAPPAAPPRHTRTPSQEKRAQEGRHAAARIAQGRIGEGGGLEPRSQSRSASRERAERRKKEQQDRIDFLASLGFDERQQQHNDDDQEEQRHSIPPEDNNNHPSRRSSTSVGDDLPHMPELYHIRSSDQGEDEEEAAYWQSPEHEAESRDQVQETRFYVRTLGKLVRKLSAIESVGSKERAERVSRSGRSASELY